MHKYQMFNPCYGGCLRTISLLIFVFAVQGYALEAPQILRLSFDWSKAHPFNGFGAQVWPHLLSHSANAEAGLDLLKDLNAQFVRISMAGVVPTSKINDQMTVGQIASLIEK